MRNTRQRQPAPGERGHGPLRWRAVAAVLMAATLGTACARGATTPDVPFPLAAIAHHGENLYDAARATDWLRAGASLDSLQQEGTGIGTIAGVSESLRAQLVDQLVTVSGAVAARDRFGTLQSANELTRLAAEATRPFEPSMPVEVTLLDYEGRLLELRAEQNDLPQLRTSTALLRQTWEAVRGRVEARRGGPAAAASFEALVARAEAATAVPEYAVLATRILDEVDALERLFPVAEKPD